MGLLNETFSIADLPEQEQREHGPLPEGRYNVEIVSANLKETKSGTGEYIKLRLDVIGPTHAGRVVFANVNIRNASATAERIGRTQLRAIMEACRIDTLSDTDQLLGALLSVRLTIKPADGSYPASNNVAEFSAPNNASAQAVATPAGPFGQPASATRAAAAQTPTAQASSQMASPSTTTSRSDGLPPWAKR